MLGPCSLCLAAGFPAINKHQVDLADANTRYTWKTSNKISPTLLLLSPPPSSSLRSQMNDAVQWRWCCQLQGPASACCPRGMYKPGGDGKDICFPHPGGAWAKVVAGLKSRPARVLREFCVLHFMACCDVKIVPSFSPNGSLPV